MADIQERRSRLHRRTTLSESAIDTITGEGAFEESVKRQGLRLRRTVTNAEEKLGIALNPKFKSILGQIGAGTVASAVVSPAMTIIDLAIIRAQFERTGVATAISNVTKDLVSGKQTWNPALNIMMGVYLSTYLTANVVEVGCKQLDIDYKVPTAVCTSIVNCAAIAWKDRAYAKMCAQKAKDFPLISYGMFALRDGLTVTSSFVLKNIARDHLVEEHGMKARNADLIASFGVPMTAQLFSTPFHILSLDIFSRPDASFASRMAEVTKGYVSVSTGRMLRIIPAFGVGGYINDVIREGFKPETVENANLLSQ